MTLVSPHHGGPEFFQPGHLAATGPGARRSKCIRFLAVLPSGTRKNQIGPPQPAASTNALSAVESSSTSEPSAAAQKVASARASVASNETALITLAMTGTIARTMDEHVVIVGAGPAGLAAAWAIRRAWR